MTDVRDVLPSASANRFATVVFPAPEHPTTEIRKVRAFSIMPAPLSIQPHVRCGALVRPDRR